LSEAEIQQMVKDAELNAEDDKKKVESVRRQKNNAEAMVHSVKIAGRVRRQAGCCEKKSRNPSRTHRRSA
jgi:molecular chaperone DnaK (HSP70)